MQTHADVRIGMLVRWFGDDAYGDLDGRSDLGIVVGLPGGDWHGCYRIAWSAEDTVSDHSADSLEESLYQGQIEIIHETR